MSDAYAFARDRVAAIIEQWNSGTITLTRSTPGVDDPAAPWIVPPPTLTVYTLNARVDGVIAEYVNDTTIAATDQMVIASPKARDAGGNVVDIEPLQSDTLTVDGSARVIKQIKAVPASGPPALFHIIIAS